MGKDLANVDNFFDTVTTPDSIVAKTAYKLDITQGANTTVLVTKNGVPLADDADIFAGDELKVSVTGGTVTVNGTAFISGDIHVVSGNVAVVSTHSE